MENKLTKKLIALLIIISFFSVCLLFPVVPSYADGITENGKYSVDFDTSITKTMGFGVFENGKNSKAIVEKMGDTYYLTMNFNGGSASDFKLLSGDDVVGSTTVIDGDIYRITYTMSLENIQKDTAFSAYVGAMGFTKEFTIRPLFETAKRIGDVDESYDRPAEFIPVITTHAGDTEMEKGSTYKVLEAKAKIKGKDIPVTTTGYYLFKGEKQPLDLSSGTISLDNAGEYHVVYTAETDLYKTSKGNNSKACTDIKIMSKVGASSFAVIENQQGKVTLPEDAIVHGGLVGRDSEVYKKAEAKMAKIADKFEVVSVVIYCEDGSNPELNENINLYLTADNTFDKRNIEVYHIEEDGELKKVDSVEPYGRYIKLETADTGNFVICIPGVSIKLQPLHYWLLALSVGTLVIGAGVVPLAFIIIKRKRAALSEAQSVDEKIKEEDSSSHSEK